MSIQEHSYGVSIYGWSKMPRIRYHSHQGSPNLVQPGAKRIKAYSDSQLVAQQLGGHCEIKEDRVKSYADQIKEMEKRFTQITIEQIARSENQRADFLAKIGSSLIDCRERKITVLGV